MSATLDPSPEPEAATRPPLTGAERMRRTRDRKRRGLLRVSLDLFSRERRALVRFGELTEEQTDNAVAVRDAIYRLLQRFAPSDAWK